MSARCLAVSMRQEFVVSTGEVRDALARDWMRFLQEVLPEFTPVLVPSHPGICQNILQRLPIEGLLLSGGNDLGEAGERDETETILIQDALNRQIPILGVCRGMQMIGHYFGWELRDNDPAVHRAKRHALRFEQPQAAEWLGQERVVNSYHNQCVVQHRQGVLNVLACSEDGVPEALLHREHQVLGVMWHPEREATLDEEDRKMFRKLFLQEEKGR